jgi:hypothetical protein
MLAPLVNQVLLACTRVNFHEQTTLSSSSTQRKRICLAADPCKGGEVLISNEL